MEPVTRAILIVMLLTWLTMIIPFLLPRNKSSDNKVPERRDLGGGDTKVHKA